MANGRISPDLFSDSDEEGWTNPLQCCEDTDEEWASVDLDGKEKYKLTSDDTERRKDIRLTTGPEFSITPSPSVPMSRIGLNDNKAGMEGLNKAKINQIILEASKGSKYYENETKKEKQVSKRIESMLRELGTITPAQRAAALKSADRELEALEGTRDLTRIIVHIDMDAFYASVEMRDDPRLRDVPMAVGGTAMLSTSNYHARRYGVRAAMPGFIAKKLCPDLVIVPLHFDKYRAASKLVREILVNYDAYFCPMGLDESYLDLTKFVQLKIQKSISDPTYGTECDLNTEIPEVNPTQTNTGPLSPLHWKCAEEVVEKIRREIHEKTGLTASAGLAPNMMLAKVASDMNKPDGQYTVQATREGVLDFVKNLPIRKISGIGKVTERMLNALKVTTCGDLYQQRAVLHLLFSQTSSTHFLRVCIGLGSTQVHREYDRKSMSTERTFAEINSVADLQEKCQELCQDLACDMHEHLIKGRTVALKLKTVHFEVKTRAVTLPHPVSSADQLFSAASDLLTAEIRACAPNPLRLRLMGVRISSLQKIEEGDGKSRTRGTPKQETLDVFMHRYPTSHHTTQDSGDESTKQACIHKVDSGVHTVQCPICGAVLEETEDYGSINTHIDECLNHSTIASITNHRPTTPNPEKIHTFTTNSPRKITNSTRGGSSSDTPRVTSSSKGGSRKRELSLDSKQNNELVSNTSPQKRRKTLDSFWK